jgi:uncharacterized membrane protein
MPKKLSRAKSKVTKIQQNPNNKGVVAHQSKHYSGPIPEPSDLQKYEDVKIGFAERIMSMAECESTHRQNIDNRIINSERIGGILGQIIAACMGLSVIVLMGYAISKGFAEQVKWIGVSIASVVGLFIYKRK